MIDDPPVEPQDPPPAPPVPPAGEGKKEEPKGQDPTELAQKLGTAEAENKTLKDYKDKADPVLQTIFADHELYKKVEEAHQKRLGVATDDKKDDPKNKNGEDKAGDTDTRRAMIVSVVNEFNKRHGMDKLTQEERTEINNKVGAQLKEMLDPMGNKATLTQVMEDASLIKLPEFLDNAFYLVNRTKIVEQAKEQGKKEAAEENLGVVGGFSSISIEPDNAMLTLKEREIAKKMGISEDKFLARKKEIAQRRGELYKGSGSI